MRGWLACAEGQWTPHAALWGSDHAAPRTRNVGSLSHPKWEGTFDSPVAVAVGWPLGFCADTADKLILSGVSGTVFLEGDFEVGPGPAFHVYLVPKPSIRSSSGVTDTMYIDLGGLRAFKGSQRYPIPAGVELKNYPSVIIWCERFSVLISPADLAFR